MKNHYYNLIEKFDLPNDAVKDLTDNAEIIFKNHFDELEKIISKYYKVKFNTDIIKPELMNFSEKTGVNYFTVCFIFLACSSKNMLDDFKRANLEEKLFWETIEDLKYKLFECKKVKGVWGNFVSFWYNIFYSLDIFKLGRLEFERIKYDQENPYVCGDLEIKKGDTVFSVHIPSCGKLSKELRMDSYKKAYDFFEDERQGKPLVCVCHSWLLFPKNKEIFPNTINLVDFMKDWDIIESGEEDNFDDAWRVFGKDYVKGEMKRETIQQKALVNWLEDGKKTGWGLGVLVFDKEKIIN